MGGLKIMEMFSLKNRTAIVTGALGLIGKEHCYALSEAGANVVVADVDEYKCKEFAESLLTESTGLAIDVTNPESIKKLRDEVINKFGHIDILVNNAAINDMFENPKTHLITKAVDSINTRFGHGTVRLGYVLKTPTLETKPNGFFGDKSFYSDYIKPQDPI